MEPAPDAEPADPLLLPMPDTGIPAGVGGRADLRSGFLQGMSQVATAVTVVTTDGPAGRAGVTVSSMSSVSADGDAPLLVVCVHCGSRAAGAILRNRAFVVNVLRDDQTGLSELFAGRRAAPGGDRFAVANWLAASNGAPRLRDALVAFGCDTVSGAPAGTHRLILGAVREVHLGRGRPLIHANRQYGTPRQLPPEPADIA